jgi:uncharacterized protein (DUF58 family)
MTLVPQNRLLIWTTLVALPFAALAGMAPAAWLPSLTIIGALAALAVLDATLSVNRLDGIQVRFPPLVRLTRDRAGEIAFSVHNPKQRRLLLRLGVPLAEETFGCNPEMQLLLPGDCADSRASLACLPRKRGRFELDKAFLGIGSRLGFWELRTAAPARCEIRVYPNLLGERKGVAGLFLNRGNWGSHAVRRVGRGRDFEKLREYVHGDGFDEIHWKATAKRGHPVTKVFQVERTQEVYVFLDRSRLSGRDEGLERCITAALTLCLAAQRQGDLFGLLIFGKSIRTFLRARNGRAHYNACRDALYHLEPEEATPDFEEVAAFARARLRRRALLVFLTSLDDPLLAESFVRSMDLIRRQHLIFTGIVAPRGIRPLFSNSEIERVDGLYEALGGHLLWHSLRELEKVLQRRGIHSSLVQKEELSARLVERYLEIKQRQLL